MHDQTCVDIWGARELSSLEPPFKPKLHSHLYPVWDTYIGVGIEVQLEGSGDTCRK